LQIKDNLIFKKFIDANININPKDKIIYVNGSKIDIDLHRYILRKSKNPIKNCIVLEAMALSTPS
jgi:hypothetical protein